MSMTNVLRYILMAVVFLCALAAALVPRLMAEKETSLSLVPQQTEPAEIEKALKSLDVAERKRLSMGHTDAYLKNLLSQTALQSLVVLRDLDGRKADSETIALALANFSRRSVTSQLSAAQIDLAAQRYDRAFSRLDGVLRAQPGLFNELSATFLAVFQNEEPRKYFAALLASSPPWRNLVFAELSKKDPDGVLTYNLLSDIRKAKGQILDIEKQGLIRKLMAAKQYDRAYFIWLDLLDPEELPKVQSVFDPGFSQNPKNMSFDWNLANRQTARIEVASKPGQPTDRVLSLDFYEDRVGGQYVFQYLQLTPGSYVHTFDVQVDEMKNAQGLVWRLRCLQTSSVIATSTVIKEKGPWEKRTVEFSVPDDLCSTQFLSLENKSAAKLDQEISGKLALDNVLIRRQN